MGSPRVGHDWMTENAHTQYLIELKYWICRKFRDLLGWSYFIEKQNKTCGLVIVKSVWGISRGLGIYLWFFCSSDSPCIGLRALMAGIVIWVPGPGYCSLACLGSDPSQSHRALSLPQPLLDFPPSTAVSPPPNIIAEAVFCSAVNSTCFTQ